jgi:hypothetical protein
VSPGNGPVTPSASALPATAFIGSSWSGARVTWKASGYDGAVLIRGRQLDGPHAVGFGEGHVPFDELQLPPGAPRQWPTFTRVTARGCYAYQVDGTSFTSVIVFTASVG